MGNLRFPDAVQESRFVQHAGEHGLSVMRSAHSFDSFQEHKHQLRFRYSVGQGVIARNAVGKSPDV